MTADILLDNPILTKHARTLLGATPARLVERLRARPLPPPPATAGPPAIRGTR